MKIAYLIPEFPGQTHTFFWNEREELIKKGVNVSLYSTQFLKSSVAQHSWCKEAINQTTYLSKGFLSDCFYVLLPFIFLGLFTKGFLRCLKSIVCSADNSIMDKLKLVPLSMYGWYFSCLLKKNVISHVHTHSGANALNITLFSCFFSGISYSFTMHNEFHSQCYGTNQINKFKFSKFVVAITSRVKQEVLQSISIKPEKIYVAPMGVKIDFFKREKTRIKMDLDHFSIVTCSRLNPGKNIPILMEAVLRIKRKYPIKLYIIGGAQTNSEKEHEGYLNEFIKTNKMFSSIYILGSMDHINLKKNLENASAFALCSAEEALGVSLMEAMSMELPVIATRIGGVPELIEDGVHGTLIPPNNIDATVTAIEYLIQNPGLGIKMGKEGRKRVCQYFHSGVSAEKIYQGIIS